MPTDRAGDSMSGPGFSEGPAAEPDPPPSRPSLRRRRPMALMLGGITGALTLGLLFGLWARPELIGSKPTPPVEQPSVSQIPLTVSPPAASDPIPRAPDRLETLPPDMAAAAHTQSLPQIDAGEPAAAPTAPAAPEAPPTERFATSFDCATARPGAEEMVCGDAALAAADRAMGQAYRRAMRAGVDPDDLRQEQRDWVAIREDAALRSRAALSQVYEQRIQELDHIADTAPDAPD
jgi:uncharacterized protein YecT (DUF1311 family)